MNHFHVETGQTVSLCKTVSEGEVSMLAGITANLDSGHVTKAYLNKTSSGNQMAYGALMAGFKFTVSTMVVARTRDVDETPACPGSTAHGLFCHCAAFQCTAFECTAFECTAFECNSSIQCMRPVETITA